MKGGIRLDKRRRKSGEALWLKKKIYMDGEGGVCGDTDVFLCVKKHPPDGSGCLAFIYYAMSLTAFDKREIFLATVFL